MRTLDRRGLARAALPLPVLLLASLLSACGGQAADASADRSAQQTDTVLVDDQWGRTVEVPADPERVVVMEWEGVISKSMSIFGVEDAIVGVDTATKKQGFREALVPSIGNAVDVGSPWSGVGYESLATLRPDVVFLEAWVASDENRAMHQDVIDRIESLGIPVIALVSPSNVAEPNIETAWEYIEIVGAVFGKEAEAAALVDRLDEGLRLVTERTRDIPDDERPGVALFATVNNVMGTKSIQSYLLTEVIGARNVVGDGTFVTVSEEQLLSLDPDVLILLGHEGYLDTSVVLEGKHAGLNWANLQELQAIRSGRMVSLGYDEWRATIETPVALLKMASVIYPEQFADVDVEQEELDFYQDVYGLSASEAAEAVAAQEFIGVLEIK